MRLDHISYAASHNHLVDVVQRLGSRIGSTFIDGGIHPRFGTRNFTLPLSNGHYFEVVCPLNHPASDTSPFGKIVSERANQGGGWLAWVLSTDKIISTENRLGRKSVEGHRNRPDGTDLKWKQIGVLDTLKDATLPFFIQWLTADHPSTDGKAVAKISKIEIAGEKTIIEKWVGVDLTEIFEEVEIEFLESKNEDNEPGLVAVTFETISGSVRID